ncbi:hypothetical protein D3C87_1198320 [compost metagenome]
MVFDVIVAGSTSSASEASSRSGQRSSLPVAGNLCCRHAWRSSSRGYAGTPCRLRYVGDATSTCAQEPRRRAVKRESVCSPVRITASNPSSITSTMRSQKSISSSTSGYCSMKPSKAGIIRSPSSGVPTRSRPRGLPARPDSSDSAAVTSLRMRRQRSRNRVPSAVSVMLRVLR